MIVEDLVTDELTLVSTEIRQQLGQLCGEFRKARKMFSTIKYGDRMRHVARQFWRPLNS